MCTHASIESVEGNQYWARTMDFPQDYFALGGKVTFFPKGTPLKFYSKEINSGYDIIGLGLGKENLTLLDGINSAGLVGGLFFFEEATTATKEELVKQNKIPQVMNEMVTFFLSQCETIGDVMYLARQVAIVEGSTVGIDAPLPLHMTFMDHTGKGIVLEPMDNGEFTIHDNVTRTMTNSPTYDWHVTNLRNYVNLKSTNIDDLQLRDLLIKDIESGSGLIGLPGDYTSPSRFVKITMLTHMMPQPHDTDALKALYETFNAVIIPDGIENEGTTSCDSTTYWVGYDVYKKELLIRAKHNLTFFTISLEDAYEKFGADAGDFAFDLKEQFISLV